MKYLDIDASNRLLPSTRGAKAPQSSTFRTINGPSCTIQARPKKRSSTTNLSSIYDVHSTSLTTALSIDLPSIHVTSSRRQPTPLPNPPSPKNHTDTIEPVPDVLPDMLLNGNGKDWTTRIDERVEFADKCVSLFRFMTIYSNSVSDLRKVIQEVNSKDLNRLEARQMLNDTLIEFGLRFVSFFVVRYTQFHSFDRYWHLSLNSQLRDEVFIFSPFFYSLLEWKR